MHVYKHRHAHKTDQQAEFTTLLEALYWVKGFFELSESDTLDLGIDMSNVNV